MRRKVKNKNVERYEIDRSPLAQKPTQRDLAKLLGESRDDLRRLINYKEEFIVRRQTTSKNGKVRDLAYPVSRLRAVHERLKFHLNKVKQPDYLFSPRKNRGQRDNASTHLGQVQYLTLDLKQFYPSTSSQMVRCWLRDHLGMYDDVAGFLTHLCTIDEKVSFGSPLTPVLCTLIHREMFDKVADICDRFGLLYSVWVDDLTISGQFVPGEVLEAIRSILREHGFRSHKIKYKTGNRTVFITGIGIVGSSLVAPNSLNRKIKDLWESYHSAVTSDELDSVTLRLLSNLGTVRHISGANSKLGQKAAAEMNSLRQKRDKRQRLVERARTEAQLRASLTISAEQVAPWV
jgi:RNA-directed DNA polymerase